MSKPVIQERDKGLSISVFEKEKETADNKKYYSVCLQRSYKKKGESEYTREEINLYKEDLLLLANLAQTSYNEIRALEKEDKPSSTVAKSDDNYADDSIPF